MKFSIAARQPSAEPEGVKPSSGRSASSSTVAIATATIFVLVTAAVGLALDRHPSGLGDIGTGWHLRGPLGAIGTAAPRQAKA